MKYYQVKKEADGVRFNNPLAGWHLIAGELFTETEVNKMNFTKKQIDTYFNKVQASKKQSYFWFGARWNKQLNK